MLISDIEDGGADLVGRITLEEAKERENREAALKEGSKKISHMSEQFLKAIAKLRNPPDPDFMWMKEWVKPDDDRKPEMPEEDHKKMAIRHIYHVPKDAIDSADFEAEAVTRARSVKDLQARMQADIPRLVMELNHAAEKLQVANIKINDMIEDLMLLQTLTVNSVPVSDA